MKKKSLVPWYSQIRYESVFSKHPRFVDFDEIFEFIADYFGDEYDIRFAFVAGNCPMSTAVFSDSQPFISIDMDMRYPVEYVKADYSIAIPSRYGGYSRGRFVLDKDYHTEFYLLPRDV